MGRGPQFHISTILCICVGKWSESWQFEIHSLTNFVFLSHQQCTRFLQIEIRYEFNKEGDLGVSQILHVIKNRDTIANCKQQAKVHLVTLWWQSLRNYAYLSDMTVSSKLTCSGMSWRRAVQAKHNNRCPEGQIQINLHRYLVMKFAQILGSHRKAGTVPGSQSPDCTCRQTSMYADLLQKYVRDSQWVDVQSPWLIWIANLGVWILWWLALWVFEIEDT